ncbi:hypothetical protein IHV25_04790 [Phaeovibrio sulfidiphilus]|uniref:Polysaccharide biosynthesis protein n=1 Tax=Phaeovibrio sulfidiphilus TaxID=1220600 RepID=A0A8J7CPF4_9PROT|nr:hypothetical protein [Phaeovibrio sulfidiphilus]MBE1236962.1 hypothetical protein [Phaeovibrio sulfidiphilus]
MTPRGLLRDPRLLSIAGASFGQIFLLGAMIVVSRAFSEEQLSEYGIVFTLFSIFQVCVTLHLDSGLVYEKKPHHAAALARAAWLVILPVSLVCSAGAAFYLALNPITSERALVLTLMLLTTQAASGGIRIVSSLIARADRFHSLALLSFFRPTTVAATQMMVLAFGVGFGRLPFALACSQLLMLGLVFGLAWRTGALPAIRTTFADARKAFRRNRDFPLYTLPQNLISIISESLIPLSLAFLFPADGGAVAMFWLAARSISAPATVVIDSIRMMVYRTVARLGRTAAAYILKLSTLLGLLAVAGTLVLVVAGDDLFAFVYGERWREAGPYAIILALRVALSMWSLPITGVLPVLRLQGYNFWSELVAALVRTGTLFLIPWETPLQALAWTTIAFTLVRGLSFLYVLYAAVRYGKQVPPSGDSAGTA